MQISVGGKEDLVAELMGEVKDKVMVGYKSHILGQVCLALYTLVTFGWLCIHVVILYGYYANCEFESIDNMCFYGDFRVFGNAKANNKVFFTLWVLSVAWFMVMLAAGEKLLNWFRMPCRCG